MSPFNRRIDRELGDVVRQVQTPCLHPAGCHRIVVLGPKGGVGKTVTAALLAGNIAELRGEITAVVDANPHTGTLRRRLVPADRPVPLPILDLARQLDGGHVPPEWPALARWHDLIGRLRVFGNHGADLAAVEAMTGEQYARVVGLLSRAAQLVVADLGTSSAGPLARKALTWADSVVIAADRTRDALEVTAETIATMADAHPQLLAGSVVVINPARGQARVDVDDLLDWLSAACAAIVDVPRDPHLACGDLIDPAIVHPAVRLAHLTIAAHVAARFAGPPLSQTFAQARHALPPARPNGATAIQLAKEA